MFQKECSGAVLIQFRRHFWRVTARLVFQVSTEKSYRGTRKKFFITFSVLARTMTLLAKCLLRKQIWAVRCSQALSYMNHEISPKRVQRSVYCHKFMQNVKLLYNSMCLASGKWFNLLRKLVDRVLQQSFPQTISEGRCALLALSQNEKRPCCPSFKNSALFALQ